MICKLGSIMRINPILQILMLVLPTLCYGAFPVVFFSDLTDGPTTGWEESTTKGAAVSIWGLNLGTTRGTSYVTVGGVDLTTSTDYAEWGATTNPTTARDLQRITFYLKSSMSTGSTTISVTTAEGTSDTIPFYTRAIGTNSIYFVSTAGSDSNTGLTTSNQWQSFKKAREEVAAGDVVYFRAGTFTAEDEYGNGAILTLRTVAGVTNHSNGTSNNSITFAAYPGEVAQVGDGLNTTTTRFIHRNYNTNPDTLAYWTFSKFKIYTYDTAIAYSSSNDTIVDNYVRYVGLDGTTTQASMGSGIIINPYGDLTNWSLLGCYLHHSGRGDDTEAAYGYKVEPLYVGGGGQSSDMEVAYNEFYNNNGTVQFYAHNAADTLTGLSFHDNLVHYAGTGTAVFGNGDPAASDYNFIVSAEIYNNVFAHNQGGFLLTGNYQDRDGAFKVYNNTFYNNCLSAGTTRELNIFNVTSLDFKNNIVYAGDGSDGGYYTDFNGAGSTSTTGMTGSYNIWYGQTSAPSWDSSTLDNDNPLLVSTSDYNLQATSPAIAAGSNLNTEFTTDIDGITRGSTWDIGAYEYVAGEGASSSGSFSGGSF